MATVSSATPLAFPDGWIRGDTIGPITTEVTGRSVASAIATLTFRADSEDGAVVQVCSSAEGSLVGTGASLITFDTDANEVIVGAFEPNTSGKVVYDLELRWADGNPKVATLHRGSWKLKQDSTR